MPREPPLLDEPTNDLVDDAIAIDGSGPRRST